MAAIIFPAKLMHEADHDWNIAGNNAVGGSSSTTPSVDVSSDGGGFWMASLNNIQFWDASFTLLWRAVRQACNGGRTPLIVPRNDVAFAPFPVGGAANTTRFWDGSTFSDGSLFSQSAIDVTCNGGEALRATTMVLNLNVCAPLQGGESFSINHPTWGWRLYEIATVTILNGTVSEVTFNPPLREAVSDGSVIEFDQPRCTMKLLNPSAMDLNVTTWPFSVATVKFIESKFA